MKVVNEFSNGTVRIRFTCVKRGCNITVEANGDEDKIRSTHASQLCSSCECDAEAIEFGTVICDLHDGFDISMLGKGWVITDKISLSGVQRSTSAGSEFVQSLVRGQLGDESYLYTNKHLVVVEETFEGLTLAASYDGLVQLYNVKRPNHSK